MAYTGWRMGELEGVIWGNRGCVIEVIVWGDRVVLK